MSRMFQSLGLLVLSCLFLTAVSETGEISPPQNLKLQWIDDFTPELSWTSPQQSVGNCTYTVITPSYTMDTDETHWRDYTILNGGFMRCAVTANCSGKQSKPAVFIVSYPGLVKNLECYLYAPGKTYCGWAPASPHLQFFYRLINEARGSDSQRELQECPSYNNTNGMKTGCELRATKSHAIHILFNGTLNKKLVRNTFRKQPKDDVRPPALNWTVTKSGDKLNINWTEPGILRLSDWEFVINYTECNEVRQIIKIKEATSRQIPRNRHCQYRIAIQAKAERDKGRTPWSAEKIIDKDPDPLLYIAFIIPLAVTVLAALTFICCQRNKEKFFPKIIKPADLISDLDNNNKSNLFNLHVAAEEEETCEITVIDPQVIRLDF